MSKLVTLVEAIESGHDFRHELSPNILCIKDGNIKYKDSVTLWRCGSVDLLTKPLWIIIREPRKFFINVYATELHCLHKTKAAADKASNTLRQECIEMVEVIK